MVLRRFRLTPFQVGLHAVSLVPLLIAVFDYLTSPGFSGNIQRMEFRTGRIAILFLILSLVCSPAFWITGYREAFKARKTLGRYAFFYALLHVFVFLTFDYAFDFRLIWLSLGSTLYLILGLFSFFILFVLAITSNPQSQAYLKNNWDRLHKLVYLSAILAVIHYFLIEKSDIRWPLTASIVLNLLFLARLPFIRVWITSKNPARKVVIKTRPRKAP